MLAVREDVLPGSSSRYVACLFHHSIAPTHREVRFRNIGLENLVYADALGSTRGSGKVPGSVMDNHSAVPAAGVSFSVS